jgi:DNA-binding CsgD family transcriptional regulator
MTTGPLTHIEARKALRRIRRLACSDLPLYPLVHSLFGALDRVIPGGSVTGWFSASSATPRLIVRGVDLIRWAPVWTRIRVEGTRDQAGTLLYGDLARIRKRVLSQEEFILPNFRQSRAYEELYHPLDAEYFLVTPLRSGGKFHGYMNLTRPRNSRGFHEWETAFMERAAPFLSHAMALREGAPLCLAPSRETLAPSGPVRSRGMIVADDQGRIRSIDPEARRLLGQVSFLAHAGDLPSPTGPWEALDRALQRVVLALHRIEGPSDPQDPFMVPEICLYRDPSGLAITLRGYRMEGSGGSGGGIGIVLEETVPDDIRRRCLELVYGLSAQESQVLRLIEERMGRQDIARILSVRESTLKTLFERILAKMELGSLRDLRESLNSRNERPDVWPPPPSFP